LKEKKIEEGIVLKGKEGEEFIPIKGLGRMMIIITVNYTNEKLAEQLKLQGVPTIEHKDIDESKMILLREKRYHSFRVGGGNALRMYPSHHPVARDVYYIIEGTGKPILQRQGIRLRANQVVEACKLNRRLFLRTRKTVTQIGIQRGRPMKFKTMLFLVPPDKARFSKRNTIEVKELPAAYLQLINASFWLGGILRNPDSLAIELTGRQPEVPPTHQLLLKI